MNYTRIVGTGSYLPKKILTNHDLEKMVDTSDEWIVTRTGIKQRHIAEGDETVANMSTWAAQRALAAAGVTPQEIELIIVATTTPDKLLPNTACLVQEQLGAGECPALDIFAACAGFNYCLSIVDQYIRNGVIKCALIIGCEALSRITDWSDRSTCVIFGDGAGAVVVRADQQPGVLSTHLHAAGKYKELLYTASGLIKEELPLIHMQGGEVFKVAVTKLGEILQETLAANQLDSSAIDWLVPHQANMRIIQALAKKLNLPLSKVVVTVQDHGNTSAASVPLALDLAIRDGRIQRNHLLLLESFGGGFTWGSALVRY